MTLTFNDGSTTTTFELDTAGDYAGADTQIDLSGVNTNNLSGASPTQVATAILAIINGVYSGSGTATLHGIVQSEVDTDGTPDSGDYVDIYFYNKEHANFSIATSSSSAVPCGFVSQYSAASVNPAAGVYLAASRGDDIAAVEAALGGFEVGSIPNGTSVGQFASVINNSSNRSLEMEGAYLDLSGGSDTLLSVAAGHGLVLVWTGSAWRQFKKYGSNGTFSSP